MNPLPVLPVRRQPGWLRLPRKIAATLLLIVSFRSSALPAGHPLDIPAPFQAALEKVRNGQYHQALELSERLQETGPPHPLAFLIAAEARWGLIFCQTGHINSREIWSLSRTKSSPYDADFFRDVADAMAASEKWKEQPETEALGSFYEGLAYGVRARLHTLRTEVFSSGKVGKHMRASLLEAVRREPSLQADAGAALGAYNYYADVLSPLVKAFQFLLLIPGGDRELGLSQLRTASNSGVLLAPEARHELAKIYAFRENRPRDALVLLRQLADQYPGNAIFALTAAQQAEQSGQQQIAVEYARRAVAASASMDPVCRQRLEPAAKQALDRLRHSPGP